MEMLGGDRNYTDGKLCGDCAGKPAGRVSRTAARFKVGRSGANSEPGTPEVGLEKPGFLCPLWSPEVCPPRRRG